MSPIRWGGGEPAVGLVAGQPPAALMDRPVVGSAQQGQVGQVGGAPVEPVAQMMGLAPGQGTGTTREDAAAVAHGQGGALGGGDDPAGPAEVQRLGGGATKDRERRAIAARSCPWSPQSRSGVRRGALRRRRRRGWGGAGRLRWGRGRGGDGGCVGDWDGGKQAPGSPPRHRPAAGTPQPATGQPHRRPHRPRRPGGPADCPDPPSRSAAAAPHRSEGAARPRGCDGPTRPTHRLAAGHRCGYRRRRLGGPAAPGPTGGSGRPRPPTTRRWRPCPRRLGSATAPAAGGGVRPGGRRPRGQRPGAGGRGPVVAGAGPAAGPPRPGPVRPPQRRGRGGHWSRGPAPGRGPPTPPRRPRPERWPPTGPGTGPEARAVRTELAAVLAPRWRRWRSHPAVEPASWPSSAPAAPWASTPASSLSHWPSSRSTSRRSHRTRSARTGSGSLSRSWPASSSTSAASAANASGRPAGCPVGSWVECVFGSTAATYQGPQPNATTNPTSGDSHLRTLRRPNTRRDR